MPNAGDDFVAVSDEKQAKLVAENRLLKLREKELTRTSKVTLESLFEQIQEGEIKELNVIVKTDVHGSQEAISEALMKLSTPEVKVNIIHNATGAITETDVMLASASNAIVIGFNVRADSKVSELADQEHVDLRYYDIIYQLLSDIRDRDDRNARTGLPGERDGSRRSAPDLPRAEIGMIAGCSVLDGRIERGAKVRVLRDQVVVYDGKLGSLRRLQGRRQGSEGGLRVWHRDRELQRPSRSTIYLKPMNSRRSNPLWLHLKENERPGLNES